MPPLYTTFDIITVRTYNLLLTLAFAACVGVGVWRLRDTYRPGAIVDVCIGGLIGTVIGARLDYVLLNWDYFVPNLNEAWQLSAGGLMWRGAIIGGLVGVSIAARLRRIPLRDVLDALTPAPALVMIGGWWACWAAACGYGAEVDTLARYPSWTVSELPDVYGIIAPRYNTQQFGMLWAAAILVFSALLMYKNWLRGVRFWFILITVVIGMFLINLLQG